MEAFLGFQEESGNLGFSFMDIRKFENRYELLLHELGFYHESKETFEARIIYNGEEYQLVSDSGVRLCIYDEEDLGMIDFGKFCLYSETDLDLGDEVFRGLICGVRDRRDDPLALQKYLTSGDLPPLTVNWSNYYDSDRRRLLLDALPQLKGWVCPRTGYVLDSVDGYNTWFTDGENRFTETDGVDMVLMGLTPGTRVLTLDLERVTIRGCEHKMTSTGGSLTHYTTVGGEHRIHSEILFVLEYGKPRSKKRVVI